jgi:competence protein ComEA
MLKQLLALFAALCAAAAFAAVDVNTATEAELDGIKGIGPGLSGRILEERGNAPFKDWSDFIGRVGGVGPRSAVNFSREGLTVGGKKYSAAAAARAEAKNHHGSRKQAADRKPHGGTGTDAAPPAATAPGPAAAASASKS